ncbi:hypothetical protein [Sporosalibacterium faouarense]|uniref:hypothetical protein n=1 Tax=Sporosalibacterium faouarense TaxID=516123 RepID=UPI00192C9DEB|nr:hypothetical protein [Sporosalibacterium faouarense]
MRRKIVKKKYFCVGCQKTIIEDDMVSWHCGTGKGICRECNKKYSYAEQRDLEKYGHILNRGEQLKMDFIPSPLPY